MIRTIIKATSKKVSFDIPEKYIGKELEVIAFALNEPSEDVIYSTKSRKSFSVIKLNTKGFKFNRDEANER